MVQGSLADRRVISPGMVEFFTQEGISEGIAVQPDQLKASFLQEHSQAFFSKKIQVFRIAKGRVPVIITAVDFSQVSGFKN